jgi:hypothetical protein
LNCSGKTPEDKERLMILVIVGTRTEAHCLTREAGIGSRSQLVAGDRFKSLETSSMVAE